MTGKSEIDPVRQLAERIRTAVSADPAVVRLDRGPDGLVATHLPGGRVEGVRVNGLAEPVEVCVVAYLGQPIPELAAAIRQRVRGIAGDVPVDVTIADVVPQGRGGRNA